MPKATRYRPSEEQLGKDMAQQQWPRGRSAWAAFNKREQWAAEGRNPVIWYDPGTETYSVEADPAPLKPVQDAEIPERESR